MSLQSIWTCDCCDLLGWGLILMMVSDLFLLCILFTDADLTHTHTHTHIPSDLSTQRHAYGKGGCLCITPNVSTMAPSNSDSWLEVEVNIQQSLPQGIMAGQPTPPLTYPPPQK